MHSSLFILIPLVLFIIAFVVVIFFYRKKDTYTVLYAEAVKKENDGYFEEALASYNNALTEVKKYKFHEKMEQQITQKIKVIKSIIEYGSH